MKVKVFQIFVNRGLCVPMCPDFTFQSMYRTCCESNSITYRKCYNLHYFLVDAYYCFVLIYSMIRNRYIV